MKIIGKVTTHTTFLPYEGSWVASFQALFPTILLSLAILSPPNALATGRATLEWSPNSESDLAGYKIYVGTTSGIYGYPLDVGAVTSFTIPNLLEGGTYYFTATAYDLSGNESAPSLEVSTTIPSPPDPPGVVFPDSRRSREYNTPCRRRPPVILLVLFAYGQCNRVAARLKKGMARAWGAS